MGRKAETAAQAARTAERFAGALMAGDPAAAARLFSPAGTCLSRDGTEVHGRGQIGALLAQVTDSEHRLVIRLGRTLLGGDVALSTQFWTRHSKPARREGFESRSTARLVLGRGEAGWQILIASPWE
jgi:ketosteroid isomerase-like protein